MNHYYVNVYSNPTVAVGPYTGLYKHYTREDAIREGRGCEKRDSLTKFLYTIKVTPMRSKPNSRGHHVLRNTLYCS